jgi:mono/diheme cytochrome c family protein
MTFSLTRQLATAVIAIAAVSACKPGVSVGSPEPGTTATPAATTSTAPARPAEVTPAAIAEGKTLYEAQTSNCARCHGVDGKGNQRGPNITDKEWVHIDGSYASIVKVIQSGVPQASIKGPYQFFMRPKGGSQLTDAQINSVAAYVYSISHP